MDHPAPDPNTLSRRTFLKGAAAGMTLSVVAPWTAPWADASVSGLVDQFDATVPNDHAQLLLRLITSTPGFTPPVVSRVCGYFGVTLYESVVTGMPGYRPLHRLMPGFPAISDTPRSGLHWPTVANHALGAVVRGLFPSNAPEGPALTTLIEEVDARYRLPGPIRRRSVDRGISVATTVLDWASTDGGRNGHLKNFPSGYTPVTGPGLWEPTPPAYQPIPLQPFWGENRGLVSSDHVAPAPPGYSVEPGSDFHAHVREVYETSLALTSEQAEIARFWADDPGTVTPPGHSLAILRQLLIAESSTLAQAAEAYLRVGCVITDSFIQCWRTKYVWNLIRPITYIRAHFDPSWNSVVTTPPFPEYTSGHSTQAAGWAEVMTALFGNGYQFTDHTHDEVGLAPRTFESFRQAAAETAVSRLYGGIHYRFSNDLGTVAGASLGRAAAALPLRA